jgi:hypothetical protein
MSHDFEIVKQYVTGRITEKVIADVDDPIGYSPEILRTWDTFVLDAIAAAGMAPFHYNRGEDQIPEPWRVHFLDAPTCRQLSVEVGKWFDLKPSHKIPGMLAGCGCLALINWLPQFRSREQQNTETPPEKQIEVDDEHLAASAAMVQNLVILLTAAGLGTYWSSGGFLGDPLIFQRLGIGEKERLLAALFVEYPHGQGTVLERIRGKNRSLRSAMEKWTSVKKLVMEG